MNRPDEHTDSPDGLSQRIMGAIPFDVYLELKRHLKAAPGSSRRMMDWVGEAVIEKLNREKADDRIISMERKR